MHHKVGVGRSYPCRCFRLELHDVSAGEQWDGVSGVRKLAKEGYSRRKRATGRDECGCNERVASGRDSVTVSLVLA